MSRRQKEPLRPLTAEERAQLRRLSRARSQPAAHVVRARQVLAVAEGCSYTEAAHLSARRSGDAVAQLIARFNRDGLAAIEPGHGGGPPPTYGATERERILAEFHRPPDLQRDGTAAWSLTTLQRALRRAPDGLPRVSTYTIWCVLRDDGWTWQRARSWCRTGVALRARKRGVVEVHDPDATAKKP
jgi:transposase